MINIIIAQSVSELKFLLNKLSKIDNLYCLPLNLSIQLYCIEKIPYINPIFYINKKFHNEALSALKIWLKKLSLIKI